MVVTLKLTNNTIVYNSANNEGGGIRPYNNCYAEASNTIFWCNNALTGGEIYLGSNVMDIRYCDVEPGKTYSAGVIHRGPGVIGR